MNDKCNEVWIHVTQAAESSSKVSVWKGDGLGRMRMKEKFGSHFPVFCGIERKTVRGENRWYVYVCIMWICMIVRMYMWIFKKILNCSSIFKNHKINIVFHIFCLEYSVVLICFQSSRKDAKEMKFWRLWIVNIHEDLDEYSFMKTWTHKYSWRPGLKNIYALENSDTWNDEIPSHEDSNIDDLWIKTIHKWFSVFSLIFVISLIFNIAMIKTNFIFLWGTFVFHTSIRLYINITSNFDEVIMMKGSFSFTNIVR